MYQISALIVLTLVTWMVAIWATYEGSAEDNSDEKPTTVAPEESHQDRKAA